MNTLNIYQRIAKIGSDLTETMEYKKGFRDCLGLFATAFKTEKSYNVYDDNFKLKKLITKLQIELDDKDYQLIIYKQKIEDQKQEKIVNKAKLEEEIKTWNLVELPRGLQIKTTTTEEKIKEIYDLSLTNSKISKALPMATRNKMIFKYMQNILLDQNINIIKIKNGY